MSTEEDGEEMLSMHITDRDENGNSQQRVEYATKRRCRNRRQDPAENSDHCDIVECGQYSFHDLVRIKILTMRADYMQDEWEEEEYDTWFNEQMAKDSP